MKRTVSIPHTVCTFSSFLVTLTPFDCLLLRGVTMASMVVGAIDVHSVQVSRYFQIHLQASIVV